MTERKRKRPKINIKIYNGNKQVNSKLFKRKKAFIFFSLFTSFVFLSNSFCLVFFCFIIQIGSGCIGMKNSFGAFFIQSYPIRIIHFSDHSGNKIESYISNIAYAHANCCMRICSDDNTDSNV